MKKMMMMAMLFVASTTAFAADSDALKAILGAKTYVEAQNLIQSTLNQLANDEEKAKAYNAVVELAYKKFAKEDEVNTTNRMLKQNDPVDIEGMNAAGLAAIDAAIECDKYDNMPNAKGKVKPKFHKDNQQRVSAIRVAIINSGVDASNNKDNKTAVKYFAKYLESAESSLFSDIDISKDANLGIASYYAGRCAVLEKDYKAASKYLDKALADTAKQVRESAFELKLYAMRLSQQTAADSAQYITDMKELYAKYPANDQVFGSLGDAYLQQGKIAELTQLCDERLAKEPNHGLSIIYKGMICMNDKKFDEAIAAFEKVSPSNPAYPQVVYNRGVCRLNKASDFREKNSDSRTGSMSPANEAQFKALLTEAKNEFEKCRELDPEHKLTNWVYLLRSIYYNLGDEAKAKELESL